MRQSPRIHVRGDFCFGGSRLRTADYGFVATTSLAIRSPHSAFALRDVLRHPSQRLSPEALRLLLCARAEVAECCAAEAAEEAKDRAFAHRDIDVAPHD